MFQPHIRVYRTPALLAQAVAEQIVQSAVLSIQLTGKFALGLSGGNTPRALYQLLATEPYAARIDWTAVEIFFGDERCVPPDDADSNFRMATEALLDHVPIPYDRIHRLRGEIDPEQAAIEYDILLNDHFGKDGLDLTLLGMGDDGHTASLFPQGPELLDTTSLALETVAPKAPHPRVTLGLAALRACPDLCVVVTGQPKGSVLRRVLDGDRTLPLTLALENRDATLFLDAACARAAGI